MTDQSEKSVETSLLDEEGEVDVSSKDDLRAELRENRSRILRHNSGEEELDITEHSKLLRRNVAIIYALNKSTAGPSKKTSATKTRKSSTPSIKSTGPVTLDDF